MSNDIFMRDLNEQMEKAEFILQRINSIQSQITEDPTCELQGKLDGYVVELKDVQLKMNTIMRFISIRDGIAKAIDLNRKHKYS